MIHLQRKHILTNIHTKSAFFSDKISGKSVSYPHLDVYKRQGLNLSAVKNKAVKFSGDGPIQTGGFNSDHIIRNEDGGLISRFYGCLLYTSDLPA